MRENRWLFIIVLIAGFFALLGAFVLSVDAIELIKNPSVSLSCDINSVISCGTVGKTTYASMFGFPNSFIGMMSEPLFIVFAIAALMGVKFPKKFMFGLQLASAFALVFAAYLFVIGTYFIHALCPWCLTVDVATIAMLFAVTRYNIKEGNLYLSRNLDKKVRKFVEKDYDIFAVALIFVAAIAVMILEFGSSLFA
jgi:uncharacterized membrane protein